MQTYLTKYSSKKPSISNAIELIKTIPWKQGNFKKQSWPNWLHHMAPYAGRMTPQIAHWLIRCFSKEQDVILDPFCGIGTVPLESNLLNRNSIGFDLNPYAYTTSVAKMERKRLTTHVTFLENLVLKPDKKILKTVPTWVHEFYNEDTLAELLELIRILKIKRKKFLLGCLIGVAQGHRIGHLSKASALTLPYKPRPDDPGLYKEVIPRLIKKVTRMYKDGFENMPLGNIKKADAQKMPLGDNSVDCVISSPPYLDNLDYVSTNRLRLALLGFHGEKAKALNKHSKYKKDAYLELMNNVCAEISRTLKKKKLCVLVIGDVHNKKEPIQTTTLLKDIFKKNHLKIIDEVEDIIPFNRSVQRTPNMENSSSTPRKDRILVMQNLK